MSKADGEALAAKLRQMMNKAHRALRNARGTIDQGDYDFGSATLYYAVFYAVEAALLTKGLSRSRHSGAISAFGHELAKAGVFPEDYTKLIDRLRQDREIGHYSFSIMISEAQAREDIQIAEEMVAAIGKYVEDFIRQQEQAQG